MATPQLAGTGHITATVLERARDAAGEHGHGTLTVTAVGNTAQTPAGQGGRGHVLGFVRLQLGA